MPSTNTDIQNKIARFYRENATPTSPTEEAKAITEIISTMTDSNTLNDALEQLDRDAGATFDRLQNILGANLPVRSLTAFSASAQGVIFHQSPLCTANFFPIGAFDNDRDVDFGDMRMTALARYQYGDDEYIYGFIKKFHDATPPQTPFVESWPWIAAPHSVTPIGLENIQEAIHSIPFIHDVLHAIFPAQLENGTVGHPDAAYGTPDKKPPELAQFAENIYLSPEFKEYENWAILLFKILHPEENDIVDALKSGCHRLSELGTHARVPESATSNLIAMLHYLSASAISPDNPIFMESTEEIKRREGGEEAYATMWHGINTVKRELHERINAAMKEEGYPTVTLKDGSKVDVITLLRGYAEALSQNNTIHPCILDALHCQYSDNRAFLL